MKDNIIEGLKQSLSQAEKSIANTKSELLVKEKAATESMKKF